MTLKRLLRASLPLTGLVALIAGFSGCGSDKKPDPGPRDPGLVQAQTADELLVALSTAVSGDTIQILAGLGGSDFQIPHGLRLTASQSPLLLIGDERSPARPRIVFPDTADGLVISGHTRLSGRETTIENVDFVGGRNMILLDNARVTIRHCTFRNSLRHGVVAAGVGSTGTVELCLFEANSVFGIVAEAGSTVTIDRNTIVNAGDCGIYVDSNATVTANNVWRARNIGIVAFGGATAPTIRCNNSYLSAAANYGGSNVGVIEVARNFELNPMFCPGGLYSIQSGSPLAELNSGGCGVIGAFEIECD